MARSHQSRSVDVISVLGRASDRWLNGYVRRSAPGLQCLVERMNLYLIPFAGGDEPGRAGIDLRHAVVPAQFAGVEAGLPAVEELPVFDGDGELVEEAWQ